MNLSNGGKFSGVDLPILTITNAQFEDAGDYDVVVSNSEGNATSNPTNLSVETLVGLPTFPTRPLSRTVALGTSTSFTVNPTGTNLFYTWSRNGVIISGANSATLPLSNITRADGGMYEARVSNVAGTVRMLMYLNVIEPAVTVTGWGDNTFGQITIPSGLTSLAQVAAGVTHSVALKGDGTVAVWGANDFGQTAAPSGLSNVVGISAGTFHSAAVKGDGTVVAWGRNDQGQAAVPPSLSNVVAVYAGGYHTLALKSDGTIVGWGQNDAGQASAPTGLSSVIGLATGTFHSVALKNDGTVVAWGRNLEGQASVPSGLTNVIAVAAGSLHSAALKSDGTVVVWGDNSAGQRNVPAGLANVTALGSRTNHYLALKSDGSLAAWGNNALGQTNIPAGLGTSILFAAGGNHNLAVRTGAGDALERPATDDVFNLGAQAAARLEVSAGPNAEAARWSQDKEQGTDPTGQMSAGLFAGESRTVGAISVLAELAGGGDEIEFRFTVRAGPPRRFLIRALGPTLAALSPGRVAVVQPVLRLMHGDKLLSMSRGGEAHLKQESIDEAAMQAGAIVLAPGDRDAVITVELKPGDYDVRVATEGGDAGSVLLEVFEVPNDGQVPGAIVRFSSSGRMRSDRAPITVGFNVAVASSDGVWIVGRIASEAIGEPGSGKITLRIFGAGPQPFGELSGQSDHAFGHLDLPRGAYVIQLESDRPGSRRETISVSALSVGNDSAGLESIE